MLLAFYTLFTLTLIVLGDRDEDRTVDRDSHPTLSDDEDDAVFSKQRNLGSDSDLFKKVGEMLCHGGVLLLYFIFSCCPHDYESVQLMCVHHSATL